MPNFELAETTRLQKIAELFGKLMPHLLGISALRVGDWVVPVLSPIRTEPLHFRVLSGLPVIPSKRTIPFC
jgi:hypothetical protein